MTCVIVGEAEVYLCTIEFAPCWIATGYRIYGIAESVEEVESIYQEACEDVK